MISQRDCESYQGSFIVAWDEIRAVSIGAMDYAMHVERTATLSQRVTGAESAETNGAYDACTWATSTISFSTAKLSRRLEHRIGPVASMKPGSGAHLIVFK
jgi:hypothetical protein